MQELFTNWITPGRSNKAFGFLQQVLILVLFLLTVNTIAQWNTQSPVPTFLDVRGVGSPTTQHVFIATDDNSFDNSGALFESNDGGATWVQLNIPVTLSNPFNGLFFYDSQYGWVYGNENYRTTDGGINWTQIPFLGSTYFMKFYSPSFGLATGNFGRYISLDGGNSWVESPNGMYAFDFFDDLIGLGVSETGIYRTTDGGNTFTSVQTGSAKSVVFLSNFIAVGIDDDTFFHSTDAGLTWNPNTSAMGRDQLLAVNENIIIAWGRSGTYPNYDDRILRSSDGGQNWTDLGELIPDGVYAFAVADQQNIVTSDFDGDMFYSSDAGMNFTQSFTSPGQQPGYLSSATPVFADAQTGYFGYGAGFIIKTTDTGASWFQISSGTGESLNDIDRFPNGNLIAVGDNGTLLTNDGFSPWIIHERFSQQNFKAVQILNANEVVIVGENGQVYKSTDAGTTWTGADSVPEYLTAADIHFTTMLDGWVIGSGFSSGALFHTTDGGTNWIPVEDFLGGYVSVDIEGSNIWAANVGGVFYRSTDNGTTWIEGVLPGPPYQIQDIDFFNESIGYAVGWYGQAFRSNDGGITWETLPTPTTDHNFTDICLLGANELWLSTYNDVAYYSATGGQSWSVMDIGSEGFGSFSAIVAVLGGDAWTVGFQGYIEHFTGPPPPPLNIPPVASFEFTASGLNVNFLDTSTDPDGFIVSWEWNFGDGSGSTEQNPSHTYDTANTYIVTLTVTDDDGDTGSAVHFIVVQPGPGGTFGDFTEVTPLDSLFITPQGEDFWVITTAPADYDNDGDLDIAVLGYYVVYNVSVEDKLVLLRNEGAIDSTEWNFTYIDVPLGSLTTGSSDLSWGDVDGDTDMDLAVGTDGATVIYRNESGNLTLSDTQLPAYWEDNDQADFDLRSISWADYDNDGDNDLLIPSVFDDTSSTFRTALMRNDGPNGTGGWIFTEANSGFAPTMHAQSLWADYDGDQDLDLLLINVAPLYDEGFIRRYRNDGNGVFFGENILGSLRIEHGEAQWGDYDGDGDLDILIAGNIFDVDSNYVNMALRIYRNDNETYVPFDVIDCIPCEGWFDLTAATWADYDSDGDMDILLAGNYNSGSEIEGRARIYKNENGIFFLSDNELPAPRASGDRGGTFSWFDLDGEGDLDYFIAGQYFVPGGNGLVESQMHLYRNDVLDQNEAPTVPSGISVNVQSKNTVQISWQSSSDDHTLAPAITYDILIVRNGTHVPIGKPSSENNAVLTRLPEPGNVSAVNEWSFSDLQDGTYEWRLRAVDAAYVGSEIAVGEFTIGVTSVDDSDANIPNEYSLEQNYPNPFNPSTTIRFSVPKEGLVTMKLYNILGEEAATIVNGIKQPGNYSLSFDATKISSGVYFYRMIAGDFSEVKKMIISK